MRKHDCDQNPIYGARRLFAPLVLGLAVLLAGCISDSGDGSSDSLIGDGSSDSTIGGGSDSSGSVSLSWEPPEAREDGSDFEPSEVDYYEVAYGTESGNLTETVSGLINTSTEVNSLVPGENYHFAVRVVDNNGLRSAYSNEKVSEAN